MLSYLLLGFLRRKAVLLMILKCYTPFQREQNIGKNILSRTSYGEDYFAPIGFSRTSKLCSL